MKTGTDISIKTCRAEGYAVVEHYGKKMKPGNPYFLTISNPLVWESGCRSNSPFLAAREPYLEQGWFSYQELWDQMEKQGKGIKEYCDFKNCPLPAPDQNPTFHDFVNLAQTLHYFCGIG
jgi:hypothetical protein